MTCVTRMRISASHVGTTSVTYPSNWGIRQIKITFDVYGHLQPGHFKSEIDELDTPRKAPVQDLENCCV